MCLGDLCVLGRFVSFWRVCVFGRFCVFWEVLCVLGGKNIDSKLNGETYTYNTGARISIMVGFNLAK